MDDIINITIVCEFKEKLHTYYKSSPSLGVKYLG